MSNPTKTVHHVISGIWFSTHGISHVMLHGYSYTTGVGKRGVKTPKQEIINLIRQGKNIYTVTWEYPDWHWGSEVGVETNGNLRTHPDNTTRDNLDKLIDMSYFIP